MALLVRDPLLFSSSSSDDASASESGVDRRKPGLDFSSRSDAWPCPPKVPKAGIPDRDPMLDLFWLMVETAGDDGIEHSLWKS